MFRVAVKVAVFRLKDVIVFGARVDFLFATGDLFSFLIRIARIRGNAASDNYTQDDAHPDGLPKPARAVAVCALVKAKHRVTPLWLE